MGITKGKVVWVDGFPQGSHLPKPCEASMKNDYYTYAYLRKDGTPYYIGKGRGRRAFEKWGRAVKTPSKDRILFLKTNLTEKEAFKHEIYMISVYGRKDIGTGILYNFTDGGEGVSNPSQETRQRISETQKGKKMSAESRRKMSEAKKGVSRAHLSKNGVKAMNKANLKPVEITFPSGRIGTFKGISLAAFYFGVSPGMMTRYIDGKVIKFNKQGYSARYLPTEATQ